MIEGPAKFLSFLTQPDVLAFRGNQPFSVNPDSRNLIIRRQTTGHVVFCRSDGHRFLMTDPQGHPLHECEWSETQDGPIRLLAARLYLDWGQWVGIKPNGLVNSMTLDLSSRPGWQKITRQDLRAMASQIMKVPLSEVEFFYRDDDLVIEPTGKAIIRQRKDALYVLQDGLFERAKFMSCMSAMHWEKIDYLPVVELFKSLLPGTGSAAFELIRGLYDDQNPEDPLPLVYRGIPTYPSAGAFGLFSNFFTPEHPSGQPVFDIFMDPPRSHEISWFPNADPPRRYVHPEPPLCVTVRRGTVQKVTLANDSTGLPFVSPNAKGFSAFGKTLTVTENRVILKNAGVCEEIGIQPEWGISNRGSFSNNPLPMGTWRSVFSEGNPSVTPVDAYSAVLLYPEDDTPIGEWSSQPFVADYLDDILEQEEFLASRRGSSSKVLVHGFDATIGTCLVTDHPCAHTILFTHGAYSQKQAQILWNQLAQVHHLDQLSNYQFLTHAQYGETAYEDAYDLIFRWIPYELYANLNALTNVLVKITQSLKGGGLAFVAGPESLSRCVQGFSLQILFGEEVRGLQPFQLHRSILPKACLNPDLWVWGVFKP